MIFELFLGNLLSFDFHIEMLKQLFGDQEVRELLRIEKKFKNDTQVNEQLLLT